MNQKNTGGYRLKHIEIFNWGTFDKNIWRLEPDAKNSLLTGANGSGKTTLVDAIITLLVPPSKRHYNQSSGAEKKRERDETSYTRGAYSNVQNASGLTAKTLYLREKENAYSILIGVFYNAFTDKYVSLAQVRWFSNNSLKRAYFVSEEPLDIATNFTPMDTSGAWKRRLKKQTTTEEFDSFSKYSQHFSKTFGLKSEKALSLFSQTVGIKVLGNLNAFIRTNMLEDTNSDEEFIKLRKDYENLLSAYQAIEQARQQVQLLEPIIKEAKHYRNYEKEVTQLTEVEGNITNYFYTKKQDLFSIATQERALEIRRKSEQIEKAGEHIARLQEERDKILIDISNDKAHEQLQNLDRQIRALQDEIVTRKKKAERYEKLAVNLELEPQPNEKQFYKNQEQALRQIEKLEKKKEENEQARTTLEIERVRLAEEKKKHETLLRSLQQRQNRLPLEQVAVRKLLLERLELPEKALPFAAELIRIKEDAEEYTPFIEQLLRSFGLALLVSEDHADRMLEYIHRLDLNGKVSFYKVKEPLRIQQARVKESVLEKIEIKKGHPFTAWLEQFLFLNYDFATMTGFKPLERFDKSMNTRGIIKTKNCYSRDDHPDRLSPLNHILGWDNQATILMVQKQVRQIVEALSNCERNITKNKKEAQALTKRRDFLQLFRVFETFGEIDFKTPTKEVAHYEKERKTLLESSNQLNALKQQQLDVEETIRVEENRREKLIGERGKQQARLETYQAKLKEAEDFLTANPGKQDAETITSIEALIEVEVLKISNLEPEERRVTKGIRTSLQENRRKWNVSIQRIERGMQKFVNPTPEILEKHPNWTALTADLLAEVNYLKEYERIHKKITEEDLPKFQERFKEWLNERLIFDIANFKTGLDNQEAIIREGIMTINTSLKNINFSNNPNTYIQLDVHPTRDLAIRDFKLMLREAMPDPGKMAQGDNKELEASFKRIKKIIEELSRDEQWRRKVTDVRNWLEFGAIERFRADDTERQYYVDSQSLSGGEKAKLAYTILASAIAYQFGIRNENSNRRSFRFAVVDEAFSKVDEKNAIYALELFRQLHLQLMVVTPLDKINLAEPYIETIHYVHNRAQKNSEVFDMTKGVYHAQKTAFQETEKE